MAEEGALPMQAQATPSPISVSADGVCVVDGYGIEIRVERGHLVVADGIGRIRRASRFARATSGLRRLVLLGHTGFITLDAVRWLEDVGARFIHLGSDGQILMTSGSFGLDDPRLRRAQALALGTPHGNEIARSILRRKLDGQSRLALRLGRPDVAAVISGARAGLDNAMTPAEMLIPEAAGANAAWSSWAGLPIRWASRDDSQVPQHWRSFGTRASPLTGNPRLAANPANAILNYLYAILEAETRLACLGAGLDPGLGVLHADQRNRDSMALDLMEGVRPEVDAAILDLLESRVFRAADFFETRQGVCRVLAPLSHELARTIPNWSRALAPFVEEIARAIAGGPDSRVDRLPTRLTQANRSSGRDRVRRGAPSARPQESTLSRGTCLACGSPALPRRRYCPACRPDIDAFQATGSEELARARSDGRDPAHGGEVAKIRGDKWRERKRLEREWERTHGHPGPEIFRLEVSPSLDGMPIRRLVGATGLTRAYCARIAKGDLVPHPRHWPAIRTLVNVE
jgi:CRISPR-associated endonuclease Cas1